MALKQFASGSSGVVATPTGNGRFQTRIDFRGGAIFADEPVEVGGDATGPTPYEMLSAALAACTAMTLRLYAGRKEWVLPPLSVEVAHSLVPGNPPRDRFTRRIEFQGAMEAERRERLLEIADRCPVHKTLMRGFEVVTEAVEAPVPLPPLEPRRQHMMDMERSCEEVA
jgi:putative redox protein